MAENLRDVLINAGAGYTAKDDSERSQKTIDDEIVEAVRPLEPHLDEAGWSKLVMNGFFTKSHDESLKNLQADGTRTSDFPAPVGETSLQIVQRHMNNLTRIAHGFADEGVTLEQVVGTTKVFPTLFRLPNTTFEQYDDLAQKAADLKDAQACPQYVEATGATRSAEQSSHR